MNPNIEIVFEPVTETDFSKYYRLRWEVLRKPWNQPPGSERDDKDGHAIHAMVCDSESKTVAVGRLHINNPGEAQIRFMAVRPERQGQGAGRLILEYLEGKAREMNVTTIVLQAREGAVDFYTRNGYAVVKKTFLLFNDIQHFLMQKNLKAS